MNQTSLLKVKEILMRITLKESVLEEKKRWLHSFLYYVESSQLWTDKSFDPINLLIKYYKCLALFEHWRYRSVEAVEATANYSTPW